MVPKTKASVLSEADIMMYLALGLKHARLMMLLLCLSMVSALFYYTYARPVYHSVALVHYQNLRRTENLKRNMTVDAETAFHDSDERSMLKELASPSLMERTAARLGVSMSRRELTANYVKQTKATFNSEKDIQIEVWPYSYEWAKAWPEALVKEYLLYRDERRIEGIRTILQDFGAEMVDLRRRMDEVFNQKFDFRDTNAMTKIIIELNHYKEVPRKIQTIKAQLAMIDRTQEALQNTNRDVVAKLALLAALAKDIEDTEVTSHHVVSEMNVGQILPETDPTSGVVVIPSMIASTLKQPWEELDKERRRLQQEAQVTGAHYLARHPKMMAIQKQLDAVNRSLELELAVQQNRFELQHAALLDNQRDLERELPAYDEIMRRYQKCMQDYKSIDAGQLAWNRIYDEMSKRLSVLDFAADRENVSMKYVGLLELNEDPISPNRIKLLLYSLFVGLALAIGVPSLIEYLDSRVSDVDQVEQALQIRSLGIVPKVVEAPVETLLLPDGEVKSVHHVTENFRLIRTNLILNSDKPTLPQVILVTSSMPQEGKTIVAAHLAMSFAQKGEKTLLIDADLRRGRVHRLFACQNRPGLSEVLTENDLLETAFRSVGRTGQGGGAHDADNGNGNGRLTLLTCGRHVHWASELLDTPVFPRVMDELRQKYQRIIVDSPPVLGLSDTAIIQRLADGVLLVIWSELTPMRNVKTAMQTLQTNGAKFAGFVLNRLDFTALTNRYKYFYYSPYYYHRYRAIEAPSVAKA